MKLLAKVFIISLRRLSLAFGSIEVCVIKQEDGLADMIDPSSVWVRIPKSSVNVGSYKDTDTDAEAPFSLGKGRKSPEMS